MNLPQPSGLLVNSIHSSSPAVKAGLQIGDVIIAVNDHPVEDPETFRYRVATLPINTTVTLGIWRKGQKLAIQANLILPPEDPAREKTDVTGRNPLNGATIENLSPAVAEETGVRSPEHGVVVAGVKGGVADNVGLQTGDIILGINNSKTPTVKDVLSAVKQPVAAWRVSVQRGESVLTVMVGG